MQEQTQPVFVNNDNESSILRYKLNVDQTLENIRLMLQNMKFDYTENKYVAGKKLYDEEYVDIMMHIIKSFINKEIILTDLSHTDIHNLVRNGMKKFNKYLLSISVISGVDDQEIINMILSSVLNYAFSNAKRALNHMTLKDSGQADIKEFNNPNMNPDAYPPNNNRGRF